MKGNSFQWAELCAIHLAIHFAGRRDGQQYPTTMVSGQWPVVWLVVKDLEPTQLNTGDKEIWGKRYVDGPPRMSTEYECICAHVNANQRTAIEERVFNSQEATQHGCPTANNLEKTRTPDMASFLGRLS